MREPKIVTLDEYVCEHWGFTPEQMRGIDICGFNHGDILLPPELPPSKGGRQSVVCGDGSVGCFLEKDDPLARALGIDPDRGPIQYFDTQPLAFYLAGITQSEVRTNLTLRQNAGIEIGYAINIFVPKQLFSEHMFDDVCDALKDKIPAEIKMDEATQTGNDKKFYGRAGSEGDDFRFRNVLYNLPQVNLPRPSGDQSVGHGVIRQYISIFGGRHRLGWIYHNQVQVLWSGSAESTIGLIRSVAGLIQEQGYEAHFDLPIDHNGLMRIGFGITGVFYKPQERNGSKQ